MIFFVADCKKYSCRRLYDGYENCEEVLQSGGLMQETCFCNPCNSSTALQMSFGIFGTSTIFALIQLLK